MGAAENKRLIHNLYAGPDKRNPRVLFDAMADDIVWTLIGSTRFSGTYRGKQAVLETFLGPGLADLEGGIDVTIENLIAEGEYVVMQAHGKARTRFGKRYDNTYCVVFRIAENKICEVTEYSDTELVAEAFRSSS